MKCENCGKEHNGSYGSGRFCSKSCKQSYIAKQVKHRVCEFTKNSSKYRAPYGTWICSKCNKIFETRRKLTEHCHQNHPLNGKAWNSGLTKETDNRLKISSEKISKTLKDGYNSKRLKHPEWTKENRLKQSERAKKRHLGGYHKHGGRGIRGWYKGFWCDSSWELAYTIYNLEHNINFIRNKTGFEYFYNGMIRKYFPDYILNDGTYVEIKGYEDEKAKIKHKTFIESNHKLYVIGEKEIQPYLNYVIEKYGKNFIKLYELK